MEMLVESLNGYLSVILKQKRKQKTNSIFWLEDFYLGSKNRRAHKFQQLLLMAFLVIVGAIVIL